MEKVAYEILKNMTWDEAVEIAKSKKKSLVSPKDILKLELPSGKYWSNLTYPDDEDSAVFIDTDFNKQVSYPKRWKFNAVIQ